MRKAQEIIQRETQTGVPVSLEVAAEAVATITIAITIEAILITIMAEAAIIAAEATIITITAIMATTMAAVDEDVVVALATATVAVRTIRNNFTNRMNNKCYIPSRETGKRPSLKGHIMGTRIPNIRHKFGGNL